MTSEISVERQFRFHCSCGAITITGERTVTCTGCGITLGVRRVRRHRQRPDSVAYYGGTPNRRTIPVRRVEKRRPHLYTTASVPKARIRSRFSTWVKTALAKCVKASTIHRIREPGQISNPAQPLEAQVLHEAPDKPHRQPVIKELPRGCVREGIQHGKAMRSEIAVERKYRFHCLCGATMVTSEKTVTCTDCGEAFRIRRVGRRRHRWNIAPHREAQTVWQLGDLRNLAIYAALCVLLLCWLYELACG